MQMDITIGVFGDAGAVVVSVTVQDGFQLLSSAQRWLRSGDDGRTVLGLDGGTIGG